MKTQLICLFLLLFLFSCKESEEIIDPYYHQVTVRKEIQGKWEVLSASTIYYNSKGEVLHTLDNYPWPDKSYTFEERDMIIESNTGIVRNDGSYETYEYKGKTGLSFFNEQGGMYNIIFDSRSSSNMVWKTDDIIGLYTKEGKQYSAFKSTVTIRLQKR